MTNHNDQQTKDLADLTKPKVSPPKTNKWRSFGLFFSSVGVFIFIALFCYSYYQLSKINLNLVHAIAHLEKKVNNSTAEQTAVKNELNNVLATIEKAKDLSLKQQGLIDEWQAAQKGDLNKWRVFEAEYLAKLANEQLVFQHQIKLAMVLLKKADELLNTINDANLINLKKSLATDLLNLSTLPQVDKDALYAELFAISETLDTLPLQQLPLTPVITPIDESTLKNLPWWKKGLINTWQTLKQVIVIRRDTNELPVIMPDEKLFLHQNLEAKLETAIFGLLHQKQAIYENSLLDLIRWIKRYFDQNSAITISVLERLEKLKQVDVSYKDQNIDATLELFHQYSNLVIPQKSAQ